MVQTISLEQGLELKELSKDFYESTQLPWTWHGSRVVPGGLLMSLAAAAAYATIPSGFAIDTLNTHFIAGPDPSQVLQQRVTRLSDGGRFATRVVSVEQKGKVMVHVTCSFVRTGSMRGPSMTHCVGRSGGQVLGGEGITLDDLANGRGRLGPWMRFQRLPLGYHGPGPTPRNPPPQSLTYTSVAQIHPPITPSPTTSSPASDPHRHTRLHALGIISLSDYHILDAPPTLHGLTFGLPAINDKSRTPTYTHFERYTSLSHTIRFHVHDGFKSDELCYIEVTSPWARERRAEVHSRIFTGEGKLIATCVQGSYYVMKEDLKGERGVGGGKEGGGVGKL